MVPGNVAGTLLLLASLCDTRRRQQRDRDNGEGTKKAAGRYRACPVESTMQVVSLASQSTLF